VLRFLENRKRLAWVALALLTLHAGLLAWGAWRHSPVYDEVGYLPAGISHWELGRFDLYCGNPPLVLWCFCPNAIANGQLFTPDMGATALGVAAGYAFWRWLKRPDWVRALVAGAVLGLAELTKMVWIVLVALWPVIWIVWRLGGPHPSPLPKGEGRREAAQLVFILLLAIYVVNLGYGFEGTFTRLGDYRFASEALGGPREDRDSLPGRDEGNRFADSWLGAIPIPLPKDYVLGIDLDQGVLDRAQPAYLRGQWRTESGWWYYYFYALAIKVPLGTWCLAVLAVFCRLRFKEGSASWRDEVVLVAPAAVVLALFSAQTSLNKHFRYVLPIFPVLYVWMSQVARPAVLRRKGIACLAELALAWSAGSSLWVYPHSLSYYNELAGGRGRRPSQGGPATGPPLDHRPHDEHLHPLAGCRRGWGCRTSSRARPDRSRPSASASHRDGRAGSGSKSAYRESCRNSLLCATPNPVI